MITATDTALLTCQIPGTPRPQGTLVQAPGSLRGLRHPNATISARVDAAHYLAAAWDVIPGCHGHPLTEPVTVTATFAFPRPATHWLPANTRRPVPELRPEAPPYPTGAHSPDVDKACRLIGDALQLARVLVDDALIVEWRARKVWSPIASGFTNVTVRAAP